MFKYPPEEIAPEKRSSLKRMNQDEDNFAQLTWGEYITLVFILFFGNLEFLTDYLKRSLIHGVTVYTTTFIFAFVFIGLPLTSLNLFLGYFSKCGFLRLWSLSPIFTGVGYTMVLIGIASIMWSSVITSLTFLYILKLFYHEIPWKDCEKIPLTKYDINVTCINHDSLQGVVNNDTCCPFLNKRLCSPGARSYPSLGLSCLYYYRQVISNIGESYNLQNDIIGALGRINVELVLSLGLTWLITIAMSTIGLNKTKSLIRKLGTFATVILVICFIISLISGVPQSEKIFEDSTFNLFNTDLLALSRLVVLILGRSLPLNVVCLGARAPQDTTTTIDALFITIVYLIMMFIFTFWTTIKIGSIRYFVQLKSVHCISRNGVEVLLALIPDLIVIYFPVPNFIVIMYYFSIYILGLSTQIIFITGLLDSLEDVNPTFHRYRNRFLFCLLLCIITYLLGIILYTTPMQFVVSESWFQFAHQLVILFAMTLYGIAIMWIYGANRLQNDIDFMNKTKLSMTFWIICWKCFPFVCVVILSYLMYKVNILYSFITLPNYIKYILATISVAMLLPIPLTALYLCSQNIRKRASNDVVPLFANNAHWGPPDSEMRRARNHFNPKHEKRYQIETLQCAHNCLVNSKYLAREIKRLDANRHTFLEDIKNRSKDYDSQHSLI